MNNSTQGVTLYAGFVFDLLDCFRDESSTFAAPLFEMAAGLDPAEPTALVPIQLYNDMCTWIEETLGSASVRRAGIAIGNRAYDQMIKDELLAANATPIEMMAELRRVASFMIQDPLERGWEILESRPGRVVMRRTQTFNCQLQDGLLLSLAKRTKVISALVDHFHCTRHGDEFCDYAVTWLA